MTKLLHTPRTLLFSILLLLAPNAFAADLLESVSQFARDVAEQVDSQNEFEAYVVKIADGDTLTVLDTNRKQHRIRLYGIDAPESSQAFGQRSRQSLADMVFNKTVRIEVADTDRYGRIVGRVFLGEHYVNAEQVRRGLAWEYERYNRDRIITDLAREARIAKRGLWVEANAQEPWLYRRGN